jgi:hypothetical protein
MVILEEEKMQSVPPPPYVSNSTVPPPPFYGVHRGVVRLSDLPPHLLLKIVYMTFPQTPGIDEGKIVRQRKTLCWLSTQLRLVNRSVYIGACCANSLTYATHSDMKRASIYCAPPIYPPTTR